MERVLALLFKDPALGVCENVKERYVEERQDGEDIIAEHVLF